MPPEVECHPKKGSVPGRLRTGRGITLRRFMVIVGIFAACFALFDPSMALVVSAPLAFLAAWPGWKTLELAVSLAWLMGASLAFSDVSIEIPPLLILFASGLALAASWILRLCFRRSRPLTWAGVVTWLMTPASGLLGSLFLATDLDFQARLALSEPDLLSNARAVAPGTTESYYPSHRNVGLFRASGVEEREGCVLWRTGGFFLDDYGLAYIPRPVPPTWRRYRFSHVRGPWWRFTYHG